MIRASLSIVAAAALAAGLLACGQAPPEEGEPVTEAAAPALRSVVSIGMEMGDSCYVFGDIRDACVMEDGTILVLDSYDNSINVYDPRGNFLRETGGQGEGPGEYGSPFGMVALEDGRILVSDAMLSRVTFLNPDLTVSEIVGGFIPWAPERIFPASGSTFIGSHRTFDRNNNLYGHLVALWSDAPEPDIEYYRREGNFNRERLRESTDATQVVLTSDFDGRVYIAPYSTSEYMIEVMDSTGVLLYTISEEREPRDRPLEEMEEERQRMREQLEREGAPEMEWNPAEQYNMIPLRGMGTDREGRLWVRDGRSPVPLFSVYSGEEHLFDVQLDDPSVPSEELRVKVTPLGILAWQGDPETFPELFLLELE